MIDQMVMSEDMERLFHLKADSLLEKYNKQHNQSQSDHYFDRYLFKHRVLQMVDEHLDHKFFPLLSPAPSKAGMASDCLLLLDFRIIKDPINDRLSIFRDISGYGYDKREFDFELQGYLHGKRVFVTPIAFQVRVYMPFNLRVIVTRNQDLKEFG